MSPMLLEPTRSGVRPSRERDAPRDDSPHLEGRLTLDELVSSAWAGLSARVPVACPLCGGRMAPTAQGVGRCRACHTALS